MEAGMDHRALSVADIALTDVDGEPRARDVDIAERLGFERPRDIRKLIERNLAEIEVFGPSRQRGAMVDIGSGAQREVAEYWLNEEQALLVAVLSRAPQAPAVRLMLIKVFRAYRRGHLASPVSVPEIVALAVEAIRRHDEAREQAIEERVVARLSRGAILRQGKTSGTLWREFGFPQIKGASKWFGNRLSLAGCAIDGRAEFGLNIVRLFDPDKARSWINSGGRFLVEQKIGERRGQGKLHLVGKAS